MKLLRGLVFLNLLLMLRKLKCHMDMILKKKSMINLEPTIADSALGKFQLAADKDKHYFESPLFKGKYSVNNSDLLSTYSKLTGEDEEIAKENGITNQQLNLNTLLVMLKHNKVTTAKLPKNIPNLLSTN